MPQIIASTYEIMHEIGSGGGGVVFLARHLRLGKLVVLKADKRKLSAKPEALRREVDALKDLSHTYIPQVYDFVEENGTVYTVMDYIDGESLDKPLGRGERFPQAQVIEWACQLLEALCYLHSRPPYGILHSDIKPSNIMVTPQNDIRLIDFNIALVLGEEGAVRVGSSRGYASPEHYGVDYTGISETRGIETDAATQIPETGPETVLPADDRKSGSTSGKKNVLLDVRSDVYSLGATLYHLLAGRRPPQDAKDVEPLSKKEFSPAVVAIIQKAMAPNPDLRYQTAAEMLRAFEHLHDDDPRMKRHRRRIGITAAVLSALFLAGGFSAFVGLKQMERLQAAYALAGYSGSALEVGDVEGALDYALQALPTERGLFDPPYTAQARKALTDALGVYDLTDGFKALRTISLASEPLKVVLSPAGTRIAVLCSGEVSVFDVETGDRLVTLAADKSALSDVVFSGEDILLYAGDGALRAHDLVQDQELWSGKQATGITLSADGSTVAAVYRNESVGAVYDVATGKALQAVTFHNKHQRVTVNDIFADPEDNLFTLNGDGTLLAASFSDGSLRVFDLRDSENDVEIYDESEFTHFEGGFFGKYFAFSATGSEQSVFAVVDMEEVRQTGGFASQRPFHVQANESGIYVSTDNILVKLEPETGDQTEVAYTDADITAFAVDHTHTLTATNNDAFSFFDADARLLEKHQSRTHCNYVQVRGGFAVVASLDEPTLRVLKLENHPDAQVFTYDRDYIHDEARLSADGETVMLFRYDRFRLYSINGKVLAEVKLPDAKQVYDQQYRRDENGSRLDVIYNDGLIRTYSAEDGALLSETTGEKPDETLYEEFFTDHLRITSPLHGTPAAYDRESGKLIRELEKDTYLTYVTQVGDYVVTEYISAQGERYGLLLDENCETLAFLPNLCDIVDGMLVFDDMAGNLRQSRIYSIQELMALGSN